MSLRRLLLPSSAVLLCAVSAVYGRMPGPSQDQDLPVRALTDRISWIEGGGGNIGVFQMDLGLFVVDSKLAGFRDGTLAAVEGIGEGGVRFLVNTHWHGDHTGNNGMVVGEGSVLAHTNVRKRLTGGQDLEGRSSKAPAGDLPVLTYEEGLTLHLDGETIEVRHMSRSHTDGDSIVFFRDSNVLHAGDIFFNKRFPFIDLGAGGSIEGLKASVRSMIAEIDDETQVIPGHGPMGNKADLEGYLEMLEECSARVAKGLAEGKDVEAMISENLLEGYESWSWNFISASKFIADLATDLGQ